MDKGRFALLRKRAKSKIKTEEKFKKMLISSRIQLQKIPLSALRFTISAPRFTTSGTLIYHLRTSTHHLRTPIHPPPHPRQTFTYDRCNFPIRQFQLSYKRV